VTNIKHPPVNIRLSKIASKNVKKGHPWIFESAISHQNRDAESGDVAVVYDEKRKFLAVGLYDASSHLRVRVLSRARAQVNADFFRIALQSAHERRLPLMAKGTNGFRLVHGEGDGLGGLVIDRYDKTMVIKLYSEAYLPHLPALMSALERYSPTRVLLRLSRALQENYAQREGEWLLGGLEEDSVIFRENHFAFEAQPLKGQKTGFFLDQRENRERVEKLCRNKRVLNVFSYSGGFSLYAARGGANEVVSIDISPHAQKSALTNFSLNPDQLPEKVVHTPITADAFKGLERLKKEGESFDVVIIDPPSFAKQQSEVERAVNSYRRLLRLGLQVLKANGQLVFASCSSRVPHDLFVQTLTQEAENNRRPLRVQKITEHGVDHPLLPHFIEGHYLKCVFAEA